MGQRSRGRLRCGALTKGAIVTDRKKKDDCSYYEILCTRCLYSSNYHALQTLRKYKCKMGEKKLYNRIIWYLSNDLHSIMSLPQKCRHELRQSFEVLGYKS